MLSVHAVHFALQSSFQAQNSTTTEYLRRMPGRILRGSGILREPASAAGEGVDSLIRSISDGGVSDRAASCIYSLTTPILCAKAPS